MTPRMMLSFIAQLAFSLLIFYIISGSLASETSHFNRTSAMRFIITSGFHTADRRHASRLTWLKWVKHSKHDISYSFYVEAPLTDLEKSKIQQESNAFQDVIVINATAPRDKSLESCSFRRWEALTHDFSVYQNKVDYYVLVDDDSFICVHHMLFDSQFWPVGREQRVHIAHFKRGFPDVISIYSSVLLRDALQVLSNNIYYKTRTLQEMINVGAIKDVDYINELRLTFGSRGRNEQRYNDFTNGWIGEDLLNATEKANICNRVLGLHMMYPLVMMDLWSYLTSMATQEMFTVPTLSRNIQDLDKTVGDW